MINKTKKSITILISAIVIVVMGFSFMSYGVIDYFSNGNITFRAKNDIIEFYHDQGGEFMSPLEPTKDEEVTLRIRVRRGNINSAYIRYTLDVEKKKTSECKYNEVQMIFERKDDTGYYDYFVGIVPKQSSPYYYHFKLINKKETLYVTSPEAYSIGKMHQSPQNEFYVMPGFETPDWAKGATWYSAMTDSFYNGNILNDKNSSTDTIQNAWGTNHFSGNTYSGGDIQGLIEKIPYMKELGVTALFINPIWTTTHNAGYGSFDFKQIDSAFGDDNDFRILVDTLHENGMKIMIDGVFRYAHASGVIFNGSGLYPLDGGLQSDDPYYEIFMRGENGEVATDWGQPIIDFSSPKAREFVYSVSDSVMQHYLRDLNVDGWRMDVGNSLSGSDAQNWGTAEQILKDMRKYVKACGKDKLFLSEHGDGNLIYDYTLDAKWGHYNYTVPMRKYLANKKAENVLLNDLYAGVTKLPNPIRNASYNYTASHDLAKTAFIAEGNEARILASNLITMTYVGSPCIFFGDEIGMSGTANLGVTGAAEESAAPSSFGSMNWNEESWDYKILNMQKTLSNLRTTYSKLFKDGAYVTLMSDIKKNVLSFGRFNKDESVVTISNASGKLQKDVEIEVKRANIKNGTILVNYLSGETYKVKDGKVNIDVQPYGAVLVEGNSGDYIQDFSKTSIGNASGTFVNNKENQFEISGNSTLNSSSDNILFLNKVGFNNSEISFKNIKGNYTVMIRSGLEKGDLFYALSVENGKGVVKVRKTKNGNIFNVKTFDLKNNSTYSLKRDHDNLFGVYEINGNSSSLVGGTNAYISMFEKIYLGVANTGDGTISNLEIKQNDKQFKADFEQNNSSMLTVSNGYSILDGKLKLDGVSDGNFAYSNAIAQDFSIRAYITSCEKAGLIAMSDFKNSVTLLKSNGKVEFGLTCGGVYTEIISKEYQGSDIFLQLERIGEFYYARYSSNGKDWTLLNEKINANFSSIKAGIVNLGTDVCEIDYFEFGDGTNYSDFLHKGYVDFNTIETRNAQKSRAIKIIQGDFEYVSGGIANKNKKYSELATADNFQYFKIVTTLRCDEIDDNGYVGIKFNGNYTLKINKQGLVTLFNDKIEVDKYTFVNFKEREIFKITIILDRSGKLRTYINNDIAFNKNISASIGKLAYIGEGAKFAVLNRNEYEIGHSSIGFGSVVFNSVGSGENAVNSVSLDSGNSGYSYQGLLSQGVSDMMFAGNVMIKKNSPIKKAGFGILLGGTAGRTYKNGGILVKIDSTKKLSILDGDTVLTSISLDKDINIGSFYMIIVYQNNQIKVFIDKYSKDMVNSNTPILTYDMNYKLSGTFNIYSEFSNVTVKNAFLYGLKDNENYEVLKPYKTRKIEEPQLPEIEVKDEIMSDFEYKDFDSQEKLALFNKYSGGNWTYENGKLKLISGSGNWDAGGTVVLGKTTEEFDIEYRMKTSQAGGWAGILFNKGVATGNHQVGGLLIYSGTNSVSAFDGADIASGSILSDKFNTYKISQRIVNGQHIVSVYVNNSELPVFSYIIENTSRSDSFSGYISLVCGNSTLELEFIKYTKKI